ncbi:MAG: oligosaccharide flippase family protein [Bacteroidales bacterium]
MIKFISWLSEKFGLDLKFLFKNSAWVTFNQVVALITGLAISVIFARFSDKNTYGQYSFLYSLLGIFTIFSIPGLSGVVFRALARGFDGTYLPSVKHSLKMGLIAVPVFLTIGLLYWFSDAALGYSLIVLSVVFPFVYPFQLWTNLLQAKEKFKQLAVFNSIVLVINFIAIAIAIYIKPDNLFLIFTVSLLSTCILNLFFYFRTKNLVSNSKVEEGWKNSAYLLLLPLMFTQFYDYIDKIILKFFMGNVVLAEYTIAVLPGDKLRFFLAAFLIMYLPKLYRADTGHLIRFFRERFVFLLIFSFVFSFLLALILPYFIRFFYSSEFNSSILPAQIYLMILPFYFITVLTGNILIKEKAEKYFTFSIVISSIANLAAYFILIPLFGIMGGVAGSFVYFMVQALMRLYYIFRNFS